MSHLPQLIDALAAERAARIAEDAACRAMPLRDRIALGHTLAPLDLLTTEHRSKGRVNVLLRGGDAPSTIVPGCAVQLTRMARMDGGYAGRCEGIGGGAVELRIDGVPEVDGPWAVSRRLDLQVHDAQVAALTRALHVWSPVKNLLLGHEAPYRPDPLDHRALASLSPEQRRAAALALGATEIGLLHGPPGTGKTTVAARMLVAMVDAGDRPFALAETNAAVDQLALAAEAAGLDVVRLGGSPRIPSAARHLGLEYRILHGARATVIGGLLRRATRATGEERAEVEAHISEEWQAAKREILESAHVLATTIETLQTRGEALRNPRTALIDDASQVSEPVIWHLAQRVKRILLVGDPAGLPPVVKSRHPILEQSLLARLVGAGFPFPALTEQHRMNAGIQAVLEGWGARELHATAEVADRAVADLGVADNAWSAPEVQFLDTTSSGADEERAGPGAFVNPGEVDLVQRVVGELRAAGARPEHLAVIAPYGAQVARLRAALLDVEVGTVDDLQGREKDIVIASYVRANAEGEVGTAGDGRRLRYGLSRARRLYIGIGDAATLGQSAEHQRLIDAAAAAGGYRSVWELG